MLKNISLDNTFLNPITAHDYPVVGCIFTITIKYIYRTIIVIIIIANITMAIMVKIGLVGIAYTRAVVFEVKYSVVVIIRIAQITTIGITIKVGLVCISY